MTMKKEIIINTIVLVIELIIAIIFEIFIIKENLFLFFIIDVVFFIKEYLNMLLFTINKYDYLNDK